MPPADFDGLKVWVAQVNGIYERAMLARSTTADCLDAKRKAGVIR